ncbi:MAG: DUF559 domain-containing protein, partial [Proteobacteria bacterium]|nr:DUF559 domain-containing protein [Pseudomonadota bacterium]
MIYPNFKDFVAKLPPNGRVMGIDWGAKRTGIAISDDRREFAFPRGVLDNGVTCPPRREGAVAACGDWGGLSHERRCTARAQSFAKTLRRKMTKYECILWKYLKNSPDGFHFRKQHPIGKYIVDFINIKTKLIIELDGSGHGDETQIYHDAARDKFLQDSGYRIIRFWNESVIKNRDGVLNAVHYCLIHPNAIPPLRNFYPKKIIEDNAPPRPAEPATPLPMGGGRPTLVSQVTELIKSENIVGIVIG